MTTPLVWRLAVACALALPIAACAPHAVVAPLPEADGITPTQTAAVTIRLGGAFPIAKAPAHRTTLGYGANETGFAQLDIVKARLKVSGPGMTAQTLAEVPWTPAAGASGTPAVLRADAPVGPNRVFTLEGINADGQVVMRLRGAATVAPSGDTAVTINFLSDATARVLEAMLKQAPGTTLLDVDRTAAIQGFLTGLCRFDANANTYDATRLPPQELLVKRLALKLLAAPDSYPAAMDPVAEFFAANPVNTEADGTFVQSMKGGHCPAVRSRIQFYVAGTGGGPLITGLHFLPYPGQHFMQFRVILVVPQNGAWQYIPLDGASASDFGELTLPALPPGVCSVALIRKAVGKTPEEFISLTSFETLESDPASCPP
ncbi:hypothetical protein D3C72_562180 [compost metagenome]